MSAGEVLRVSGVSKSYGRLKALDGVSFSIRPGEVLGLIGPNGAGKTTLFECLAGVLPSDSGTTLPREGAFYLPDAIAPWPAQTVRFGLDFMVGFFGGRAELREEVTRSLSLGPLLTSRIGELSKGQRKRVLLGLGLLAPQSLLLIDEPFDGLDLRQSREVAATLRTHASMYASSLRQGMAMVTSGSDMACPRYHLVAVCPRQELWGAAYNGVPPTAQVS